MRPLYYLLCLMPDCFTLPYARRFYSSGKNAATHWVKDMWCIRKKRHSWKKFTKVRCMQQLRKCSVSLCTLTFSSTKMI